MYVFKESLIIKGQILVVCLWIAICTTICLKMELQLLPSIIIFLSGFGTLVILKPIVKIQNRIRQKKIDKDQLRVNKHIEIAKKQQKKMFTRGPEKQHTVWARNHVEADRLYNLHINPKTIKKPNKAFYYISAVCHNLNE